MINTNTELSRLIEPLLARSSLSGESQSFTDDAADHVLKRLGVDSPPQKKQQSTWTNKNRLTRWADDKAFNFFDAMPTSIGVEVNSGISTRFHRISSRADWPQFSWLMVNTPSVNECLEFAFPEMDNFSNLASKRPVSQWLEEIRGIDSDSVLAIIGESEPLSTEQIRNLFSDISKTHFVHLNSLELVIFHHADNIIEIVQEAQPAVRLKDICDSSEPTSILTRVFSHKEKALNAVQLAFSCR